MNKRQVGQYNMLLTVETHFNINAEIWSGNDLISSTKAALSEVLEQISAQTVLQRNNSTGATLDKASLRKDLEEKGFFIRCMLSAYLHMHPGQNQEFKRLDITRSAIKRLRENDLLAYIEELNTAASLLIVPLEPYGITEATLTALMAARTAFHAIMSVPVEVTANRRDATMAIAVLLPQATALLKKTMDKLMELFRSAQPDFVNVYFMERRIHHIGTRTLALMITTLDAMDYMPLAEARIEVMGHGIKRISAEKGRNKVQNLKEGYYKLSVSRTGYESQLISFSIISGKTTHVIVELEAVSKVQSFKGAEGL